MVLQTMDWQVPVRVFVIENDVSPPKFDAVRRLLADHGYAPYNPSGVDGTGEQVSKGHLQKCVGSKKRPSTRYSCTEACCPAWRRALRGAGGARRQYRVRGGKAAAAMARVCECERCREWSDGDAS